MSPCILLEVIITTANAPKDGCMVDEPDREEYYDDGCTFGASIEKLNCEGSCSPRLSGGGDGSDMDEGLSSYDAVFDAPGWEESVGSAPAVILDRLCTLE